MRKNGWKRRESKLNGVWEETDRVGGDGSAESGRHPVRVAKETGSQVSE